MDELDGMDEIVHEFLVESYENLDQLDQDLVALESDPGSRELLSSIFRTVHTIKGTAGFLGLGALEGVSHVGEGLLSELRDGLRTMDQAATDVLLALVDTLRAILADIEAGKGDAGVDTAATIAAIRALQDGDAGAAPAEPVPTVVEPVPTVVEPVPTVVEPVPTVVEPVPSVVDPAPPVVEPVPSVVDPAPPVVEPVPSAVEPVAPVVEPAPPAAEPGRSEHGRNAADSSIRVDVDLLDSLMRQVGELVLARNQIHTLVAVKQDAELSRSAQRLSLIASELQEGVMKTRMQPIEHIWSKMPRVVRDLSSQLGRKAQLTMIGGDTELDRSLLEAVKDPLTHIIRNAVDHGIEPPAERLAAGKPEQGTVTLRAYHAGGQVVVEVSDDGHGLDPSAIGASAVKKGLRTVEQVRAMAPGEIYELLFLPGFSTATTVTNVSGRGVGMDVVRTNVEGIGGSVDVESTKGLGTTWRLRIPLTLAIMPALTVSCSGETFAITQANLLELVAVEKDHIEYVGSAPVYRLRGALLPLVYLTEVLEMGHVPEQEDWVIAVLQADEQRFGLVVDHVMNTEDIVVKALSPRIKQIGLYSGATVLGDGSVSLILDVQAVARRALSGEVAESIRARTAAESTAGKLQSEQLLVVAVGEDRHVAMPLSAVTRLERMSSDKVEKIGHREVIQYRGDLLPLLRLDRELSTIFVDDTDELAVVISGGGQVAIVVGEVVDIVEDEPGARSDLDAPGLVGSTVIAGRVVELLDIDNLLRPYAAAEIEGLVTV